jgi:hypothetical protein
MRNALNKLADTVKDPAEKKVSKNPQSTQLLSHDTLWKLVRVFLDIIADDKLGPVSPE